MFAVIVAILWYYKVLQWLVRGLGLVVQRSMGISGALGTGAAAGLFWAWWRHRWSSVPT